jgi:hypothetical protein
MQTGTVEERKARKDAPARPDLVPPGLVLEDLKFAFHGNIYAFLPGQPFLVWGANWKRKQKFTDLPGLTRVLGFEDEDSRVLPSLTKRCWRDSMRAACPTRPRPTGAVP